MVERKMAAAVVQPPLDTMSTHFELQMVRAVIMFVLLFINNLILGRETHKSVQFIFQHL